MKVEDDQSMWASSNNTLFSTAVSFDLSIKDCTIVFVKAEFWLTHFNLLIYAYLRVRGGPEVRTLATSKSPRNSLDISWLWSRLDSRSWVNLRVRFIVDPRVWLKNLFSLAYRPNCLILSRSKCFTKRWPKGLVQVLTLMLCMSSAKDLQRMESRFYGGKTGQRV
jgi:hypothetical protein